MRVTRSTPGVAIATRPRLIVWRSPANPVPLKACEWGMFRPRLLHNACEAEILLGFPFPGRKGVRARMLWRSK